MPKADISRTATFISWLFQILAAITLLQSLYFKLAGAKESVYIFETLGMEPWGRYLSGVLELFSGLLLLIPGLSWMGALLGLMVISVAILFHITILGIEVLGDGGALFYLASTVFLSCVAIIWIRREEIYLKIKKWRS